MLEPTFTALPIRELDAVQKRKSTEYNEIVGLVAKKAILISTWDDSCNHDIGWAGKSIPCGMKQFRVSIHKC